MLTRSIRLADRPSQETGRILIVMRKFGMAQSSSFETPPSISGLPEIDIKFASRGKRDLQAAPQDEGEENNPSPDRPAVLRVCRRTNIFSGSG
jgi:hypothetical protein